MRELKSISVLLILVPLVALQPFITRTAAPDNSGPTKCIAFRDSAGRLLTPERSTNGLNIDQCGAYGDGSHDDTAAINAALTSSTRVTCTPGKKYLVRGTVTISNPGTVWGCPGATIVNAQSVGMNAWMDIAADNVTINELRFIGSGRGIKIGANRPTRSISLTKVGCDSTASPGSLEYCFWLFNVTRVSIDQCATFSTGYGVIQEMGTVVNGLRVSRCVASDMMNDFVELNGANSPANDVLIDANTFSGSHDFPKPQTEARFLGITNGRGYRITNNNVQRVAGDAAIHIEGSASNILIQGNTFTDCMTSNGNDGWIYVLTSSANMEVSNNRFLMTDAISKGMFAVSTGSNAYSNPMIVKRNTFLSMQSKTTFGAINLSFHVGETEVSYNNATNVTYFIMLNTTSNLNLFRNTADGVGRAVYSTNVESPSGGGGSNITLADNHFDCLIWCVRSGANMNGTQGPSNWTVLSNVFGGTNMGVALQDAANSRSFGNRYGNGVAQHPAD